MALLVAASFFSVSCKSDYPASGKAASPDSKTQPRQVRIAKVSEMPIGETVTVNGTLAAYDRVTVSMKVPGRLQTITVDLGTAVHKGQSVAQLEQQDYKLRVQQNEAALAQYDYSQEEFLRLTLADLQPRLTPCRFCVCYDFLLHRTSRTKVSTA